MIQLQLQPDSIYQSNHASFAGMIPNVIYYNKIYTKIDKLNIVTGLYQAILKTYHLILNTCSTLANLLLGKISINNLSGLINIAHYASVLIKHGLNDYLIFLAILSVNIGLINIFPLPIYIRW
ncbi:MAG: hypothetical protein FT671_03005 [Pantoea sp. Brub]|nr:hypothetical protein [Pantoea sp. Brub]